MLNRRMELFDSDGLSIVMKEMYYCQHCVIAIFISNYCSVLPIRPFNPRIHYTLVHATSSVI